ncbi:hypothetical protein PENSPDRAFT_133375 [Peniophora sp. CONT]|nr:hypothetical protein PENSPDRAFT_133375 [Peniophora sp. CONT]
MVLITCNSFGDILAVVQLVRDVIRTLDEARGAADEYTRFVFMLNSVGTAMEGVHTLAEHSRDEGLRQAVFDEVKRVHEDITSAKGDIVGFEKLAKAVDGGETYPREVFTKLRWRFRKASDADKYTKRFGESLVRLNTFIGVLTYRSTLRLFTQQQFQVLRIEHNQSRAIRESTDEIKASFALSVTHQASVQSRQEVTEQALALPFFSWASQDRRVVASVKRVTDTIFDHVAPGTPPEQREQFLSILAPFAMTSAAFVLYTNMDPRWRITSLWATVVALVVEVLWLRSCMPTYPKFDCENAVILIDALGERIIVPFQLCGSSEMFHDFLLSFYTSTRRNVADFVQNRLYELYSGESSRLISWGDPGLGSVRPGCCIEMGIILVNEIESELEDPGLSGACPYCESENSVHDSTSEFVCSCCSRVYRETRECIPVVRLGSVMGGFSWLRRDVDSDDSDEEETGKDFAMELGFCDSITNAQFFGSNDCHIDPSTVHRIPRIRVINLQLGKT